MPIARYYFRFHFSLIFSFAIHCHASYAYCRWLMPCRHATLIAFSRLRRHASHAAAATPLPPPFFIAAAILMADATPLRCQR
jgi:hypothetical protein